MILVLDVQPPIQTGCPKDIFMNIANLTVDVNWTVPSFHDHQSQQYVSMYKTKTYNITYKLPT
jgi:hypothetical protein